MPDEQCRQLPMPADDFLLHDRPGHPDHDPRHQDRGHGRRPAAASGCPVPDVTRRTAMPARHGPALLPAPPDQVLMRSSPRARQPWTNAPAEWRRPVAGCNHGTAALVIPIGGRHATTSRHAVCSRLFRHGTTNRCMEPQSSCHIQRRPIFPLLAESPLAASDNARPPWQPLDRHWSIAHSGRRDGRHRLSLNGCHDARLDQASHILSSLRQR